MIENNPTNVEAAFEMFLEEIEAESDFVDGMSRGHLRRPAGPTLYCSGLGLSGRIFGGLSA